MSENRYNTQPLSPVRNCEEALGHLYHFIDGHLDDARRTQISGHLDKCGPCVDAFDFHAELRAIVARKSYDEIPDTLKQRVFAALTAETAMNLTAKTSPFDRPSPFSGSADGR